MKELENDLENDLKDDLKEQVNHLKQPTKKISVNYADDLKITKMLIKEQNEFRAGDLIKLEIYEKGKIKPFVISTFPYKNKFKFTLNINRMKRCEKIVLKIERFTDDSIHSKAKHLDEIPTETIFTKEFIKEELPFKTDIISLSHLKQKEIENFPKYEITGETSDFVRQSLRNAPSDELSKEFLNILEHTLTKRSFSNYSQGYKEDFRSKASLLFIKHWHKFNPTRARLNYVQRNGKLFYKEPDKIKGVFGWFSLLTKTGIVDEIKRLKKIRESNKENIYLKNQELQAFDSFSYNN